LANISHRWVNQSNSWCLWLWFFSLLKMHSAKCDCIHLINEALCL
jgi:hypothetical protein